MRSRSFASSRAATLEDILAKNLAAVAQSLRNMHAPNCFDAVEISERTGDTERAMESASGKIQRFCCLAQQREALGIRPGNFLKNSPACFGIGAKAGSS